MVTDSQTNAPPTAMIGGERAPILYISRINSAKKSAVGFDARSTDSENRPARPRERVAATKGMGRSRGRGVGNGEWERPTHRHSRESGNPASLLSPWQDRSAEHTSELKSLMRISYAVL